jgi:methyl-accepting chemotaxis protein
MVTTAKTGLIDDFKSNSSRIEASIAAQFYERYGDVQAFAINPTIMGLDSSKIESYLNQYSVMYGIYDLIIVTDLKGNLIAVNSIGPDKKKINVKSLFSKNYSNEPWFKATVAGKFTDDISKGMTGTFVEDPSFDQMVSDVYGEQRYGSSFSTAIRNEKGEIIGVISNRAGSRWFEAEVQKTYLTLKEKGLLDAEITLLDKTGNVFADYDPNYNNLNKLDVVHNPKILGKLNLAELGLKPALDLKNGKSGVGFYQHARKKIIQLTAFSPIKDEKFITSLGWGVLVRTTEDTIFHDINNSKKWFYILFVLALLVSLYLSYKVSNSVSLKLELIIENLSQSSIEVSSETEKIATASGQLALAVNQQSASLQETSTSIEEISAIVTKNSDHAKEAHVISARCLKTVESGSEVITELIESINTISIGTNNIAVQINLTNQEIQKVVDIIIEIGQRTKVINDIVFQTKLLSFNASVEAARAGEAGKGFAVVAEEVGNLATMSGNAAHEISSMLNESVQSVTSIVENSKNRIQILLEESKLKVENGLGISSKCKDVFQEVLVNTINISKMISDISNSSFEQGQGIIEINKAVVQLDSVTFQNSETTVEFKKAADTLSTQVNSLNQIINNLHLVVSASGPAS